jgi:hypothetical protein
MTNTSPHEMEINDKSPDHHKVTISTSDPIENALDSITKKKIKKILYIVIVYCWLPIVLLVMAWGYGDQIKFNPPKKEFMTIQTWMIVHGVLGLLDALSIILIIIFNSPSKWDWPRFMWFLIWGCRFISFIWGSFIFWKKYNEHELEPLAVKVIVWIALMLGWVVFLTQGCCPCKFNQWYAVSIDVLDII